MDEIEIVEMGDVKRIALIAHDNRKQDLLDWASYNVETLESTNCMPLGEQARFSRRNWVWK